MDVPLSSTDRLAESSSERARAHPARVLADLAPGATARVDSVDTADPVGRRLLDLGFTPGTRLAVVRRAPLGDPVVYELRGMRLCLRRSEARRIRVRPE